MTNRDALNILRSMMLDKSEEELYILGYQEGDKDFSIVEYLMSDEQRVAFLNGKRDYQNVAMV